MSYAQGSSGSRLWLKEQVKNGCIEAFERLLDSCPLMTVGRLRDMHWEYNNGQYNPMFDYVLFIGSRLTPYDCMDWDLRQNLNPNWIAKPLDDRFQFCLLKAMAYSIQSFSGKAHESLTEAESLLSQIKKSEFNQEYINMMAWGHALLYKSLARREPEFQRVFNDIRHLKIMGSYMSSSTVTLLQHEKDTLDSLDERKDSNVNEYQMKADISHIALSASAGYDFLLSYIIAKKYPKAFTPEINHSIHSMLEYIQKSGHLSISERVVNFWREFLYLRCLFELKKSWWSEAPVSYERFLCDAILSYKFNLRFGRTGSYDCCLRHFLKIPRKPLSIKAQYIGTLS